MQRRYFLRTGLGLLTCALTTAAVPAQAASVKKPGNTPTFIQLPLTTVITPRPGRRHGSLSVEIGLHATTAALAEKMTLYLPRLRDAYVTTLQTYASSLPHKALVETEYLSGQLQATTDRIIGQSGVKVLLGSVILN